MDYNSLTGGKTTPGSIAQWANYGLFSADDVLADAQAFLYQTLRLREMVSDVISLSFAQGDSSIALPTGFLDPIDFRDQYLIRVKYRNQSSLMSRRVLDPTSGLLIQSQPRSYAIFGEKIQLDCAANAAMVFSMLAYVAPAPLSSGNTTNFLTTRYPHILRRACLVVAAEFRKDDDDFARESGVLETLISDANAKNDLYLRNISVDADYTAVEDN